MKLAAVLAVALLIAAATTINTQHLVWTPGWPVRLGLAVAGLVILLAVGRRTG